MSHPRRDGMPPGFCFSPLPNVARVKARRKARYFYGNTSVAGRAGAFRRASKRRLCDAGPRFQVFDRRSSSEAVAQTKNLQPAPGRDSYWSRAEPRHRPSAECVFGPRAPRPRPASTLRLAKRPLADKAERRIGEVLRGGDKQGIATTRRGWACPGHPRFRRSPRNSWMPATSAGMTSHLLSTRVG
jgi:hypothetical protein